MVAMKALVFLVAALAATTVVAAPPDPLMWIWQRAWPSSQPQQQVPLPKAAPKAVRTKTHRQQHRPAPKITKHTWEPIPGVRPIPPIAKPERKERPTIKRQRAATTTRLPSCSHVKREYDRMTAAQRWAAYMAATSEQVAHGRRCLGF